MTDNREAQVARLAEQLRKAMEPVLIQWLAENGVRVVDAAGGREPPEQRAGSEQAPLGATRMQKTNGPTLPQGDPPVATRVQPGADVSRPEVEAEPLATSPVPTSPRAAAPEEPSGGLPCS